MIMFSQMQRMRWLAYEEDKSRAVERLLSFSSAYIILIMSIFRKLKSSLRVFEATQTHWWSIDAEE